VHPQIHPQTSAAAAARRIPIRTSLLATLLVAAVIMAVLAVASASPARAAASPAATPGSLTFYSNTNFTGWTQTFTYATCPLTTTILRPTGSFDHRPLAGCQPVLLNSLGQVFKVCAGRGVVPVAFRQSPRLRFVPGTPLPCGLSPTAA
jgi:hypothetical protein